MLFSIQYVGLVIVQWFGQISPILMLHYLETCGYT